MTSSTIGRAASSQPFQVFQLWIEPRLSSSLESIFSNNCEENNGRILSFMTHFQPLQIEPGGQCFQGIQTCLVKLEATKKDILIIPHFVKKSDFTVAPQQPFAKPWCRKSPAFILTSFSLCKRQGLVYWRPPDTPADLLIPNKCRC